MAQVESGVLAPRVIAALDFGTTFSGIAFASASNPGQTFMKHDWVDQPHGFSYPKTKTSLLLDNAGGVIAWGWSATAAHLADTAGAYHAGFKLSLAPGGSPGGAAQARSLIVKYLQLLGSDGLRDIRKQLGTHVRDSDVQWVLTVPAIWDDAAKAFMRSAAEEAGLVKAPGKAGGSSHPLVLVLEPEAAAIYCHSMLCPIPTGIIMVVDVGGGTTDIVVHKKTTDDGSFSLRETIKGAGGCFGGTHVDAAFLAQLATLLPGFEKYQTNHSRECLDKVVGQWEKLKRAFDGNGGMTLELPSKLVATLVQYEEENGRADESAYDDDGILVLEEEDMRNIFDAVVDPILDLIDAQLLAAGSINAMFVVGGFSESPYLTARIKKRFRTQVPLIWLAPSAGSAVVAGAVIYGQRPDYIRARCSRLTYGVQCAQHYGARFGETEGETAVYDDTVYVINRFKAFVIAGEAMGVDAAVTHVFEPTTKSATVATYRIYSCLSGCPKFTTDPRMTELASVEVDIPFPATSAKRAVRFGAQF